MKTTLYILTLGLLLTVFSCEQDKMNTIKKVTVAFSGFGCESECPFQAVSIDSSLNIYYYGGLFAYMDGYYKGKISRESWEKIKKRFYKFIVNGIDTTQFKKTDHPSVEFYIIDNIKKQRFKENTGKMTKEDLDILYWFISLASQTKTLEKCDSLPFDTNIQYQIFPRKIDK